MSFSIADIQAKTNRGEKIVMLTAYDYPMGLLLDQAGVDIILVGDSLANVVLGLASTRDVTMDAMIHHAKAVRRAVKQALLVGDMPYEAYQMGSLPQARKNARRFIEEAGCAAVKLEWFDGCLDVAQELVRAGIAVMGHVGLTPQRADELGGFKVQGRQADAAIAIIEQAKALEKKGCFAVVLECLPYQLAGIITKELTVPTIGIGAGPGCDGQVLVTHDLLGITQGFRPKFVKPFAELGQAVKAAVQRFKEEVSNGTFPDRDHSYRMEPGEYEHMRAHFRRT